MYNPDEMLSRMPNRVLEEWLRYEQEEPFGQLPLRIGFAAAALGNLLAKPKGRRSWRSRDFMPDVERKRSSADDQMGTIYGIAKLFGAEIKDPKGLLKRYE